MSKKLHKNGDSNIWERIGGRSGGTVASLVASSGDAGDRRIWAGTMAGVFFSNDEGKSWSISNSGLTSPFIQAMGVSPDYDNDGNLFASANQAGGFVSWTGASQWIAMDFWGVVPEITCVGHSPAFADDKTAIIGTDDHGIFRTVNNGRTWNASNSGLPEESVLALLISPDFRSDQRVFCSVPENGVFGSSDGGRTWKSTGEEFLGNDSVQAFDCSPSLEGKGRLFAGCETSGMWFSDDGGKGWRQSEGVDGLSVNAIAVSPNFDLDKLVFLGTGEGGVYRSSDGGKSFQMVTNDDYGHPVISILALNGEQGNILVLAGTYENGVIRSEDAGDNWNNSSDNLASQNWLCFALSSSFAQDQTMFAGGANGGIFKSVNGGKDWTDAATDTEELTVHRIAVSPAFSDDGYAIAATEAGLLCTTDGGDKWELVDGAGTNDLRTVSIAKDFSESGVIVTGGALGRLFLSVDRGKSFNELDHKFYEDTIVDVQLSPRYADDGYLFVATFGRGKVTVHRSLNGGTSWKAWVQNACDSQWASVAIPSVFTKDNDYWYFATENQVFKPARRFRQVWSGVRPGGINTAVLSVVSVPDFDTEPVLFVGTSEGVYRSGDAGLTWEQLNTGLENKAVLQVAIPHDYHSSRCVYLVGLGGEIWRYIDVPDDRGPQVLDMSTFVWRDNIEFDG